MTMSLMSRMKATSFTTSLPGKLLYCWREIIPI